ncbi:MAG: type II toxin-antitoxin system RelE family toxin [Methanomicrobiales archaeon]
MDVQIARGVIKTLKKYPPHVREQIFNRIRGLKDPHTLSDVECLFPASQIYRMHIGRSYTIIFKIVKEEDTVLVLDLMTIEQAHKRYRRYH